MSYVEIINGVYLVGDSSLRNGLDCNPYLMVDGDEAVLFDPGSPLDFEIVLENILKLVKIEQIKYVVLHHQDPDFCSQVPLLENAGLNATIVTSWRAMTILQYYGFKSPFSLIEERELRLELKSGRQLKFIPTPYLHFPGAFATYDEKEQLLFSSDLFGAFSYNRTLYADKSYLSKMLTFHEHYMPSNAVLRPVMETLKKYPMQFILPQHGSIINQDIELYIEALRNLECGTLIAPIRKELLNSGGFLYIFNEIYQRLLSLFPHEEVDSIYQHMDFFKVEDQQIVDYEGDPLNTWRKQFNELKVAKGVLWLTVIEPFVKNLCGVYDLPIPDIFIESLEQIDRENSRLKVMNEALDSTIKTVNEKLTKCPITGLYNQTLLRQLLIEELETEDWRFVGVLVTIGIDDFTKYKLEYGLNEEKQVLNTLAYMLKTYFSEQVVFRMTEADFALYLKEMDKNDLIEKVEQFRMLVEKSEQFLVHMTISLGAVFPNELILDAPSIDMTVDDYIDKSLDRLRIAKNKGKNYFSYVGEFKTEERNRSKVLLVDSDIVNIEVLSTFLSDMDIEVSSALDGYEALIKAREFAPNLIISDVILDKMDGYLLKEELLKSSETKDIEMIYLSHHKDEESVNRALQLGVIHYLKKPYLLSELLGIVNKKSKGLVE